MNPWNGVPDTKPPIVPTPPPQHPMHPQHTPGTTSYVAALASMPQQQSLNPHGEIRRSTTTSPPTGYGRAQVSRTQSQPKVLQKRPSSVPLPSQAVQPVCQVHPIQPPQAQHGAFQSSYQPPISFAPTTSARPAPLNNIRNTPHVPSTPHIAGPTHININAYSNTTSYPTNNTHSSAALASQASRSLPQHHYQTQPMHPTAASLVNRSPLPALSAKVRPVVAATTPIRPPVVVGSAPIRSPVTGATPIHPPVTSYASTPVCHAPNVPAVPIVMPAPPPILPELTQEEEVALRAEAEEYKAGVEAAAREFLKIWPHPPAGMQLNTKMLQRIRAIMTLDPDLSRQFLAKALKIQPSLFYLYLKGMLKRAAQGAQVTIEREIGDFLTKKYYSIKAFQARKMRRHEDWNQLEKKGRGRPPLISKLLHAIYMGDPVEIRGAGTTPIVPATAAPAGISDRGTAIATANLKKKPTARPHLPQVANAAVAPRTPGPAVRTALFDGIKNPIVTDQSVFPRWARNAIKQNDIKNYSKLKPEVSSQFLHNHVQVRNEPPHIRRIESHKFSDYTHKISKPSNPRGRPSKQKTNATPKPNTTPRTKAKPKPRNSASVELTAAAHRPRRRSRNEEPKPKEGPVQGEVEEVEVPPTDEKTKSITDAGITPSNVVQGATAKASASGTEGTDDVVVYENVAKNDITTPKPTGNTPGRIEVAQDTRPQVQALATTPITATKDANSSSVTPAADGPSTPMKGATFEAVTPTPMVEEENESPPTERKDAARSWTQKILNTFRKANETAEQTEQTSLKRIHDQVAVDEGEVEAKKMRL